MKEFSIIVAMDKCRGIGKDGDLPWHLPADLKYFKALTTKTKSLDKINAVIMGRKTWESIPEKFRPLPGRLNIVLSRQTDYVLPDKVLKSDNLESVLMMLSKAPYSQTVENVFVIGGQQIFEKSLQLSSCKNLFITQIEKAFPCDVFFPEFDSSFSLIDQSERFEEQGIPYVFAHFQR